MCIYLFSQWRSSTTYLWFPALQGYGWIHAGKSRLHWGRNLSAIVTSTHLKEIEKVLWCLHAIPSLPAGVRSAIYCLKMWGFSELDAIPSLYFNYMKVLNNWRYFNLFFLQEFDNYAEWDLRDIDFVEDDSDLLHGEFWILKENGSFLCWNVIC